MGVWIETVKGSIRNVKLLVTPCMGVWIETNLSVSAVGSLPVTPCMGVWIETLSAPATILIADGHTLYGCVD